MGRRSLQSQDLVLGLVKSSFRQNDLLESGPLFFGFVAPGQFGVPATPRDATATRFISRAAGSGLACCFTFVPIAFAAFASRFAGGAFVAQLRKFLIFPFKKLLERVKHFLTLVSFAGQVEPALFGQTGELILQALRRF